MENLKKVISLSQASKISGYHSDYLSALIRKGEIKGKKVGKSWFTTEEELRNYKFKQKVRHKKFALVDFMSPGRTKKIIIWAGIIFSSLLVSGLYLHDKNRKVILQEGESNLSSEVEVIEQITQW